MSSAAVLSVTVKRLEGFDESIQQQLLEAGDSQYILQIQVDEQTKATTRKSLLDGYEWNESFKFKDVRNTDVVVLMLYSVTGLKVVGSAKVNVSTLGFGRPVEMGSALMRKQEYICSILMAFQYGSEIDSGGDSGGSSSKSGKRSLLQESVERALSRPQVVVPSGPDLHVASPAGLPNVYDMMQLPDVLSNRRLTYEELDQLIEEDPSLGWAYHCRALLQVEEGHVQIAMQDLTTTLQLEASPLAYYNRALLHSAVLGAHTCALRDLDEAIRISPNQSLFYNTRGVLKANRLVDWDGALEDLDRALQLDPANSNAYHNRGALKLHQLKSPEAARADLEKAMELQPNDAFILHDWGIYLQLTGRVDEAVAAFGRALSLNPTIAACCHRLSLAKLQSNDHHGALNAYTELLRLKPDDHVALTNRGLLLMNYAQDIQDYVEAEQDLSQAIEAAPSTKSSLDVLQARAYLRAVHLGDTSGALDDLDEALEVSPNSIAFNNRAMVYMSMEQYDKAITDLNEAINLDPREGKFYFNRAMIKEKWNDTAGALEDFGQALRRSPTADWFVQRGSLSLNRNDEVGALQDFEMAHELEPTNLEALLACAPLKLKYQNSSVALAMCNAAVELAPQKAACYATRGSVYLSLGQMAQAHSDFNTAIGLQPDYARAYIGRSMVKRRTHPDPSEALQDLHLAVQHSPKDPFPFAARALMWSQLGQDQSALRDLNHAVFLDPGCFRTLANRGKVKEALGDADGALQDYSESLRLNRKYAKAFVLRALLKRRALGDLQGAMDDLNRAVAADKNCVTAYVNRALLRAECFRDVPAALVDLDHVLSVDRACDVAYFNRANLRAAMDPAGALTDYNHAIGLNPSEPLYYMNRGNLKVERLADPGGARADYDQALTLAPDNVDVVANRGLLLLEMGDGSAACRDFDVVLLRNPADVQAYINRGMARLTLLQDSDGARRDFQQALQLEPQNRLARHNLDTLATRARE
eukprot:EG_transcript_1355